ncbi:protein-glutamate O-methyltransferase CheR [Desulfuromonas acetoxidans]|uniref:protein-glutamate O-methyltransferase n=1 Tax=Desulfuromonas acetoxidans (strain DSM 684 / 11070) TaxID=281689 RepID=Q1JZ61_DESA6|nr:CheR family methyltransferase [Desulfuromonas acetoxidans]EAT15433.1 MCP methyltransferase, CheR-type [Desulfuromonas acetoxidans DSM 684]MBF0647157.1 methyltransferase domain-containing protein [Desulfuromonas acetoxidans]NVD25911.1 methyltransferase domain-containing protein [Desulfuromonas acetoxidans]NVE17845.1 methyltransferase domain-containing protein [Desulfuromonas acetoxidans]
MSLTQRDFDRLSRYIYQELGITLSDSKRSMLMGRLTKRVRALKLSSISEYCDFIFTEEGQKFERVHLFDVITTNKTDFFREANHFDYLTQTILPSWQRELPRRRSFKIWSAGCSSGEEPYTMSMVLADYAEKQPAGDFNYEIIATDISTKVLDHAKKAIYHADRIVPVPMEMRSRYLLRSKDRNNPLVRIAPVLRKKIRFGRLNFMDADFSLPHPMDVIFCRNVIIYFDKETQERLVRKFCRKLQPGGFLFLGHSESLHGFDLPLTQVAPTVYRVD